MYKQYGKFDVGKLKKITTMEAVMKYHVWEQEACLKICEETSIEKGTWSYEGFIIFFVFHWFMLPYFSLFFIFINYFFDHLCMSISICRMDHFWLGLLLLICYLRMYVNSFVLDMDVSSCSCT